MSAADQPAGAAGSTSAPPAFVRYVVQPGLSRLTVKAFASGFLSALGHDPSFIVREFTGEARIDPAAGTGSARLDVKTASLELVGQMSEIERRKILQIMNDEVLDIDKYPTIVYDCSDMQITTEGSRFTIVAHGDLTLHGVTRPYPITVKAMRIGDSLRANGELALSLKDFAIKPPTIGGSMLKIKDEVKLSFDLVAKEQT